MAGGPVPHSTANSAEVGDQTERAFRMRLTGMTLAQIGKQLGISPATVHRRINDYLTEHVDPAAKEWRSLELERLEDLTRHTYGVLAKTSAETVKLAAIDRLIKLSERRSRLLGLDAPLKISAEAQRLSAEIHDLLDELFDDDQDDEDDDDE